MNNRSFAYETIKDRLPVIVTRIVDFLARHRAKISKELGEVSVFFMMLMSCLGLFCFCRKQNVNANHVLVQSINYDMKSLE